jgi:RimJ/RimL family protein N-acetyltransferase
MRCDRQASVARLLFKTLNLMSTSPTVRKAQDSDAEGLLELRKAVFEETSFMLWEAGEFKATVLDEQNRISRINSQSNSRCFVAQEGAHLIGFLSAIGGQVNRQRHAATLAIGVRKSHWRRGVGSALLLAAISWSREVAIKRLELTVHTTNIPALKLYEQVGFKFEGVRRSSLFVENCYVDEYLMSVINEV